ncbi:hypothetical protein GCM10016234_21850 [Tianweitania populi]|uniref:Uncharacterized protein n=1 Tax=Tianweitania populi TaxID=1607949 RepID=A0A8J3DX25_9HYPH|nr:hypothetical protein GCM10016234_21850 [Tianweitania populi]
MRFRQTDDLGMRDPGDSASACGPHAMIHLGQEHAVQINKITGNVDGADHPLAAPQQMLAIRDTLQQYTALRGPTALPNNGGPHCDGFLAMGHPFEHGFLFIGQAVSPLKIGDEWMWHSVPLRAECTL